MLHARSYQDVLIGFLSCLLHYYGGVAKEEVGEEGVIINRWSQDIVTNEVHRKPHNACTLSSARDGWYRKTSESVCSWRTNGQVLNKCPISRVFLSTVQL